MARRSPYRFAVLAAAAAVAAVAIAPDAGAASPAAAPAPAPVTGPVLPADLSVHLGDIPDGAGVYPAVLKDAVQKAIAHQSAAGSFEIQNKTKDLGDNSLGVSSLLALYYTQTGDTSVIPAFQKSIDWYLANRVYTTDNPGDVTMAKLGTGFPYAAYEPYTLAAGGPGDWPTTVWALLHTANVLQYGDGLLRPDQLSALENLGVGYWKWLTQASQYNPQDADNQGIGSVDGAIQLSQQLTRLGRTDLAAGLQQQAMDTFTTKVRPLKECDRGYCFYPEHSGGFDQNYGAISISFLWRGWQLTGDKRFYEDGLEMSKYLDMRLSARGFDYGGPRHNEDHPGYEALYGLQHYSGIVKDDLGRYLGTSTIPYYHVGTEPDHVVTPDGHVAFITVWQMTDPGKWYQGSQNVNTAYKLRQGAGSLVLDQNQVPYLVTAGNADVIDAATSGQQSIGPAWTDATGTHFFTPALNTTPISIPLPGVGFQGRMVVQQLVGPKGVVVPVTTLYRVGDGTVRITASVLSGALPAGVTVSYVTGLPYLTDLPGSKAPNSVQQKILGVTGLTSGTALSFGTDGGTLSDPAGISAGPLSISSPYGVTVTNPGNAATNDYSSSATLGKVLEAYSTALDPNPNVGWAQTQQTNLVQAPAHQRGPLLTMDVTFGAAPTS